MIKENHIGAHLSIKGSILNLFKEAEDLNINTVACFTGSNLRYTFNTDFDKNLVDIFKEKTKKGNYRIYSHACYLINIASKEKTDSYKKSIEAIQAELNRCSTLGILGAVIHPGSNPNRAEGLKNIADTINYIFETYTGSANLLLESSAGQGSTLPVTLEEISIIYNHLSQKSQEKTKLVIDTCHVHAAGYNLSTKESVEDFLNEFDKKVGLEKVALIHLNDSKKECGSKIDRHENIGKGTIGLEGFSTFLKDKRIIDLPKILETPVENYMDWKKDLETLESILR